jgi:hypothetical protein
MRMVLTPSITQSQSQSIRPSKSTRSLLLACSGVVISRSVGCSGKQRRPIYPNQTRSIRSNRNEPNRSRSFSWGAVDRSSGRSKGSQFGHQGAGAKKPGVAGAPEREAGRSRRRAGGRAAEKRWWIPVNRTRPRLRGAHTTPSRSTAEVWCVIAIFTDICRGQWFDRVVARLSTFGPTRLRNFCVHISALGCVESAQG